MLRDLRIFGRNSGKNSNMKSEGNENLPMNPGNSSIQTTMPAADSSRLPLNSIPEPTQNPRSDLDQELGLRSKIDRTPSKIKGKGSDLLLPHRTPEKHSRARFGWGPGLRTEPGTNVAETDVTHGSSRCYTTPRSVRTMGRAGSNQSETSSAQSTPTKSVTKPNHSGFVPFGGSRPPLGTGARTGNFNFMSKGLSGSSGSALVVNTVDVPHFELREDPSFWMDHNVQVLIRVRPLNSTEQTLQGYNRCLKQESAQSIAWIGQPENRFTFDHVACETVNQEMLFRVAGLPMVENCLSGYNSCMFAYGQTGSGKTHTMLGEIDELEIRPSPDRGMTPRIFEFLFARIRAEEESRQDEKLKYHCKCSFLEIYNEQITDLLDPSSTNLLLREDIKKGVYVENLTEYEVETVNDIIKLLIQGAANRKVAATNMNRESSRSHSVFTCVIESQWEKDSTTNLRFARLNLVDLAGSERQKTSGAEGERLKEAANINKSLSTLGHVIMILVDVAHGKQRHIPYRDSRLTFLLQDSLGGNSKTMIIANVSPSICCSGETLSTLKFAQRAKLIQNNAVVNEDASGDVIALQHQIRLLKDELFVLKRQNVSRSLSFRSKIFGDFEGEGCDTETASMEMPIGDVAQGNADNLHGFASLGTVSVSIKQLKSLEATLAGALRREKMADTTIKQLEAEIEQLNRLVRQREEYTRSTKMTLRFREDKIRRMESLLDGLMPAESYLLEENSALAEEIQLLHTQVDRNPEVTRFALENIRLLDQLRRFQDFYEEGEREILLAEVSELRDQLVQFLDGKFALDKHPNLNMTLQAQEAEHVGFDNANTENDSLHMELKSTCKELESCRSNLNSCLEINSKLTREIDDLRSQLNNLKSVCSDQYVNIEPHKELYRDSSATESQTLEIHMFEAVQKHNAESKHEVTMKHTEEIMHLQLEVDILKIILEEERLSRCDVEERALRVHKDLEMENERYLQISKKYGDAENELKDIRSVIEALESQQILSIDEMEDLRESNNQYVELLRKQEVEISSLKKQIGLAHQVARDQSLKQSWNDDSPLHSKLKRMQDSLEKARTLNMRYQSDEASNTSHEREMDEIRGQVEAETAEVIICLQEELAALQQQMDDSNAIELGTKQNLMILEIESEELRRKLELETENNRRLGELLEEKEAELTSLSEEWERVGCEISEVLSDANMELEDASGQVEFIADSFPRRSWIGEQVGRMIRIIAEKEFLIEELQKCLEEAQNIRSDMEWKLRSLRGATLAITEAQQQESIEKEKEVLLLTSQLREKMALIVELENMVLIGEDQIRKAEIRATAAFTTVKRLTEINSMHLEALKHAELQLNESTITELQKDALLRDQVLATAKADEQIQALKQELEVSDENAAKVNSKLEEEQDRLQTMELQLEKVKKEVTETKLADDLVKTKEKLSEFKMGVCTLNSCMYEYIEKVGGPDTVISSEKHDVSCGEGDSGRRTGIETTQGISDILQTGIEGLCNRDLTVLLLRKEIESAFDSLKGVQDQMSKLLEEREENKKSEKNTRASMECLTAQIFGLQRDMDDKEKLFEVRMLELDQKLETIEEIAEEANACWCLTKEVLEVEISNAKIIAAQKTTEASGLLANFEEAQETIAEADVTVNALVAANQTAKLEIEKYKKVEITLTQERDYLVNNVQCLQASNDLKEQRYRHLEKQFHSNLAETRSLILALEDIFSQVQTTFNQESRLIVSGIHELKSELLHSTNLTRSWLEDIWSEIIGKDCAVSILHLCHMGILLEMVTGLSAENGFLHHGLCESNSVISDLREHNFRAKKELEMCSILKGKLLVDIKNSFNRITRKEDETGKLSDKVSSFEKKIVDLRLQEESMLARSNSMGSELAALMKELEINNSTVLSDQEKLMKEKDELYRQLGNSSRLLENVRVHYEMFRDSVCKGLDFLVGDFLSESDISLNDLKSVNIELKEGIEYYEALIECQTDLIMIDLAAKEFELLIMVSEMKQNIIELNQREIEIERMNAVDGQNHILKCQLGEAVEARERLSAQVRILNADTERLYEELRMKEAASVSSSAHISAVDLQNQKLQVDIGLLQASILGLQTELDMKHEELNDTKNSKFIMINDLESRNIEIVNLSSQMGAMEEENRVLKDLLKNLKDELSKVVEDLKGKMVESEFSSSRLHAFDQENRELQEKVCSLEACITTLQTDLNLKIAELAENEALNDEMRNLKDELSKVFQDLQVKRAESKSSSSQLRAFEHENHELQEKVLSLEDCITTLQTNLGVKISELAENEALKDEVKNLRHELSKVFEDLKGKRAESESLSGQLRAFEQENHELEDKVCSLEACITTLQTDLNMQIAKLAGNEALKDEVKNLKYELSKVIEDLQGKRAESESSSSQLHAIDQENSKLQEKICSLEACIATLQADLDMKSAELVEARCSYSVAAKDLDLKTHDVEIQMDTMNALKAENGSLEKENSSLRTELLRKDEVLDGLLFDLSLLQESASNAKDQKDEYEEMVATLESLEDDLAQKSSELDEVVSHGQMLEFELSKAKVSLKHVSAQMEELFSMKNSIEEELLEKSRVAESLERELVEMSSAIGQMNDLVNDLKSDLCKVTNERDCFDSKVLVLREQLEMAQALADENEAIAVEARQIAEAQKNYAEDKEEEVKLLEKSVEELESTVNVLENKVEIVKGEAERQRLQREELELKLQTVKHQLLTVQASGAIAKAEIQNVTKGGCDGLPRHLEETVSDLQEAHKQIQILEKNVAEKDAEIVQCKAHISELNMHAEAQAQEYKLKFKELEAMAQHVKPESTSFHLANSSSTKSEKHAVKSRGSGSPFKCIGLGLTQQINSEKDEELNAGRLRIEELEALAASRQKEIFMLNTRLAAADSMTHDVIRDLLGVKLDMTNYALLLDHHQVQKLTEKPRSQSEDSLEKEQEVVKLKQQLNEFIEERQRWLDEINRRQAELVAAQIALEKLRQRDQSLTTENDILKMDNVNHKKKVRELEDEMKKLSGQQNLQQRIHHHAKIKEENNLLRSQNEELGAKLRRTEAILSRMKEELSRYRSSSGRDPYLDIDGEKRLMSKLEDTEEERVQLAQKLLSLCTSILKAAGITSHVSEISPSVAEDALNQLKDRITSLETELQEVKFKNRISNERIRLSELRQQPSPLSSRTNENCAISPRRALQIPSLSTLSETIDGPRRLFNMDR